MTIQHEQRLGKASATPRRLLALLIGLLATIGLIVSGAGPASAQNVVGPQPVNSILTVGPQGTASQAAIGLRGPPGLRHVSATGVAADTASTSWADASELDRTVDVGGNSVSILGDVSRSGSTVTVDNIALYGTDGELVNQVGGQALRGAGASLLREASDSGVNQVIFRGVRAVNSSGKAGHAVNWIATLGDDGSVNWTLGR